LGEVTDKSGWLTRLCSDYHLPTIQFSEDNIHVLKDEQGQSLNDIRTESDNILLADMITSTMQEIIEKYEATGEDCALHVSIAGGRKTMGYYVGYSLSLLGRPQDRLSHVLVSENYEGHPEFYYPTPYTKVITTRDNKPLDTNEAEVSLAYIPFVRLRAELPRSLISQQMSFSDLIQNAQKAISGDVSLVLDIKQKLVIAGGKEIKLEPINFAFLWMMVDHTLEGNPTGFHFKLNDMMIKSLLLTRYEDLVGIHSGDYEKVEENLKNGVSKEFMDQRLTKIRKSFVTALGKEGAKPYLITQTQLKIKEVKPYMLTLTPDQIQIITQ
jgi:CRISPR-associated protein (TIGR02584 family)